MVLPLRRAVSFGRSQAQLHILHGESVTYWYGDPVLLLPSKGVGLAQRNTLRECPVHSWGIVPVHILHGSVHKLRWFRLRDQCERATDSSEEGASILDENSHLSFEATAYVRTEVRAKAIDKDVVFLGSSFERVRKLKRLAFLDELRLEPIVWAMGKGTFVWICSYTCVLVVSEV
jgi:hypothetical protein